MGKDPASLPFPGLPWLISHFSASPSTPDHSQGGHFRHHPLLPESGSASFFLRKLGSLHSASSLSSSSSSLSLLPPSSLSRASGQVFAICLTGTFLGLAPGSLGGLRALLSCPSPSGPPHYPLSPRMPGSLALSPARRPGVCNPAAPQRLECPLHSGAGKALRVCQRGPC